jgi:hypothetical protein
MKIGKPVVGPLIMALKDRRDSAQRGAADTILKIEEPVETIEKNEDKQSIQ